MRFDLSHESPGHPTDGELMLRIGQGDRTAWGELARRHQANIVGLAYRFLGRADLAEDLAQDALLRILRSAEQYRPDAQFTTWLYRVVVNLCWDRRRQAAREARKRAAQATRNAVANQGSTLENSELAARVRRAVQDLPDRQRLAVVLHRYRGLSHKEIAEVTGWSNPVVESCLVRAYAKLRDSLSDLRT